jgi:elongator complex protein 1
MANVSVWHLRKGIQPPEALAALCDALRIELEKKDLHKYINSILVAYVVKSPPDHEAALALLLRLRGQSVTHLILLVCFRLSMRTDTNPEAVEDAVKYIIFLVDADKLFDTALAMYDFSLVLMIAQHAQKVWYLVIINP